MDPASDYTLIPDANCNNQMIEKSHANHPRKDFYLYKCSFCDYSAKRRLHLTWHIRSHTKERPYKCPHPNCHWSFSRQPHLKRHLGVHITHGDEEAEKSYSLNTIKCSQCDFKTVDKWQLHYHLRSHSNVRPFPCPRCPYRAKHQGAIKTHHKVVHLRMRPHKCPHSNCNFASSERSVLKRHLLVHTKTNKVKEDFINNFNSTFRIENETIVEYHKVVHKSNTMRKACKCFVCSFDSSYKRCQIVHIRCHTDEFPHSWKNCPHRQKLIDKDNNEPEDRTKRDVEKDSRAGASLSRNQVLSFRCKVEDCDFIAEDAFSLTGHLNMIHRQSVLVMGKRVNFWDGKRTPPLIVLSD